MFAQYLQGLFVQTFHSPYRLAQFYSVENWPVRLLAILALEVAARCGPDLCPTAALRL